MKRILTSAVLIPTFLLIAVFPIQAQRVDSTAQWLIVAPNVDAPSRKVLDSLVNSLIHRGKIPSDRIHRIEGDKCSRDGIEAAIRNLASRTKQGERFILYFRGFVTIPPRSNTFYFLTYGATSETPANALETGQLNRWFRAFALNPAIVILEGYTKDPNLEAFYANREMLASAAFVSIQPADVISKAAFAQNLLAAFQNDAADLDENRQLSIDELHRYILMNASAEGGTLLPTEGILVPTGNVEAIVLKLSPMLKVVTVPDGASVFLNGKESGVTPKRMTDNLERGTYNVEVRKRGYLIPPRSSIGVNGFQGEGLNLSWNLEPIAVYGSITAPNGKTLEGARVWIEGTEYEQMSGGDGAYRFADWKLEPGKTYTLRAEEGERYHASVTFTYDGYEPIRRDLTLAEKTWFEVAQTRFNQKRYDEAVAAFQNGIEVTTDFPPMSPAFTQMLFDSFSAVVSQTNLENIAYAVTTAKLADGLGLQAEAKVYWAKVRLKTAKGTAEYKLATQRLRALNLGRRLINIGIFVVLLVVLISGGYLIHKQRKERRGT